MHVSRTGMTFFYPPTLLPDPPYTMHLAQVWDPIHRMHLRSSMPSAPIITPMPLP